MIMDEKIKTATITWTKYNNYGTLLQCYALQFALKNLGYYNRILDDSWVIEPYQKTARYRTASFIHRVASMVLNPFGCHRYDISNPITDKLCRNFVHEYLDVDYDVSDLIAVSDRYDCFICGSDQIWNPGPSWYKTLNTSYYYAGFTNKKKVSYAPSLGISSYPEKHKEELASYISDFAFLSCREKEGCDIISQLVKRPVEKVVDPTLLLSESDWRALIGEKKKENGYILCYFLSPQQWYWDFMKYTKISNGLRVLCFDNANVTSKDIEVVHGGPKEFLELIDGANYVFTDSFHASLFSSILRTNFYTFERFNRESPHYPQNYRLKNFFSMIGVDDRFIAQSESRNINLSQPLDFDLIEHNIQRATQSSYEYLKQALYGGNLQ